MPRFDLTLFEEDDVTPFFGTANYYDELTEADFSDDPAHPRPYLMEVRDWSATEIDFAAGSSTIGGITVQVLDKRTDPDDQDTGILTARLADVVGKRALLRRDRADEMVTAFNGVVQGYRLGGSAEGLVVITLQLRDMREREREQPLFFSNFVLYGADNGNGPGIDYGALPGGGYLLDAVEPETGTFDERFNDGGVYWGYVPLPSNVLPDLGGRGDPAQEADGLFYHRDVWVRWRATGYYYGDEGWVELRNMPTLHADNVVQGAARQTWLSIPTGRWYGQATLYLGSLDPADLPADGQEIEYQILASEVSEETPFFWDGGTFGDLLREIHDGVHSPEGTQPIPYDPDAMDDFAAATPAARMIVREPVDDMREWVQEHIYKPLGYAPALDAEKKVVPRAWARPTDPAAVPIIPVESLVPIGDFEHTSDTVLNAVEFRYVRESVKAQEVTKKKTGRRKYLLFGPRRTQEVEGTLTQWERFFETEVLRQRLDVASIATFGTKMHAVAPLTVRAIGDVDGRPAGGDTSDELGTQLADRLGREVIERFRRGAPAYAAEALASDPDVANLVEGDWCRPRPTWFPSEELGRRDLPGFMQVRSIDDSDPIIRRLALIAGGVPDLEAGTGEEDCLTGGELVRLPGGRIGRVFTADGTLTNVCDHPVTLQMALLIAGGGGGGTGAGGAGGGGGAGGVIELDEADAVTIAAGAAIPVHVGSGGATGANGERTVLWLDVDGTALDPGVDPPPAAYHAVGGGAGGDPGDDGATGGSGGGGGASYPVSGGSSTAGGAAMSGQGSSGGNGESSGGLSTCQHAGAGGGGSYAGPGQSGEAIVATEDDRPTGGVGGDALYLGDFGVTAGGGGTGAAGTQEGAGECSPFFAPGTSGTGRGAGGGGSGFPGATGIVVVVYEGAGAGGLSSQLEPPTVSSATPDDDAGTVEICIEDPDWPPVAQAGYRVRVDYAVNATEPAATSGLWRSAGYLDAPGCITTPPVPTGAKVWHRAIAEADEFLPSEPSTAADTDAAETPGLLAHALTIDEAGVATVTWEPNAFAGLVRIRGLIHDGTVSLDRPLAMIADVSAATGTYELPGVVGREEFYTVDLEAWESAGPTGAGRIYRLSEQQPAATLGGLDLVEGAIPVGGENAVPTTLPPGPEGWLLAIVDGVPTYVNPADFLAGLGGPVVRRILHLVYELTRNATAQSAVRNIYDQADQAVTATAETGCTANTVYSAGLNLQGIRCQVPAGASGHRALVRGMRHEAPLKHLLNTGAGPVTVVNGQEDWWMRTVDTVFLRLVTTGHPSDILLHFGMGHITTHFTVGVFVGFEVRRTDTELRAVVWSGVAGVSTYHEATTLTGFSASEAHRCEVRIGYNEYNGGRFVEWYVDGFLAHSWAPPVATDIVFTTEVPNDSTWSTWWSCYVANSANAAETWGMIAEGCIVEVMNNADTVT